MVAMDLSRRRVGALALLSVAGTSLAGCGAADPGPTPSGVERSTYGADREQQLGELSRPSRDSVGTVVLLHGGYWQKEYGLDLMRPMARDLVGRGWTVWNLEYRRLGSGGGWPATFEDVAAGIDHLAALDVDTDHVLTIGHSAGGQLAAWAASRTAATPGGRPEVPLAGAISLAGVVDLTAGAQEGLGGGACSDLVGGTPAEVPQRYRLGDPTLMRPTCPVVLFRGRDDTVVPASQGEAYLAAARKRASAGAEVTLQQVEGDHFTIIEPSGPSWSAIRTALDRLNG